jgi:virulence-associated protein VapD
MCLSDNEVQQINCKLDESSNEQSHIYADADQILERYGFHARDWFLISRTHIYR